MKTLFKAVILAILLSAWGAAAARPVQQPDAGSARPSAMEPGTVLYVELSKTVDAKKAKAGDVVTAQFLADVVSHGKILFRRETRLVGHVTEAQPHTKDVPESRLGIVFDKVLPKGAPEVAFSSVMIAVRPAPRLQIESLSAPSPPGTNPASAPQPERHYPTPKGPSVPLPSSSKDPTNRRDMESISRGSNEDLAPSDIEGLSLERSADGSNRIVVSFKQTVKLESGVRLELRVGNKM
jgi:hypothetical protein